MAMQPPPNPVRTDEGGGPQKFVVGAIGIAVLLFVVGWTLAASTTAPPAAPICHHTSPTPGATVDAGVTPSLAATTASEGKDTRWTTDLSLASSPARQPVPVPELPPALPAPVPELTVTTTDPSILRAVLVGTVMDPATSSQPPPTLPPFG